MNGRHASVAAIAILQIAVALAGCGAPASSAEGQSAPSKSAFNEAALAVPEDAELASGQTVYRENCATCHNRGKKGAPKVGDHEAWAERLAQGNDTLFAHATEGYIGPSGSEMPARGGTDDLTDAEVRSAVLYLTSNSR